MKIIFKNLKQGEIKLKAENPDDLWCLSQVIEAGDTVRGKTLRKIKIGDQEQRKANIVKKSVFIEISVESVEFHEYSAVLRVSGVVKEGPEDVSKGSHHTFNVEPGTVLTIIKEWRPFQAEKVEECCFEPRKVLICIIDRDNACYALIKRKGFEILSEIRGNVEKKADLNIKASDFYKEAAAKLRDYSERLGIDNIVVASPAFWKEDFVNSIKDQELLKKITLASCSASGKEALNEVIKRPELMHLIAEQRVAKELECVELLLEEIAKSGLAAYGEDETENAASLGAIDKLLVTDGLIMKKRQENSFGRIEGIMETTENTGGSITVISSENEAGKKLDGLGGIGAILRYKLVY